MAGPCNSTHCKRNQRRKSSPNPHQIIKCFLLQPKHSLSSLFSFFPPNCYKMLPIPVPTTLHKFPLIDVPALSVPLFLLLQTTASTNQDVSLIPWASQLASRLRGKPKVCFPQAKWLRMPELDLLFHIVTSISLDRRT